jgi:glycosyltransferase involved in cell wall biosynthesis
MAAAVQVVAKRVGGTPEVVVHGATSLLVEPRLPDAMADAMVELARAPERRRAFALAGRARVEACFTLDRMVADYAREYERLSGTSGPPFHFYSTPRRHEARRSEVFVFRVFVKP